MSEIFQQSNYPCPFILEHREIPTGSHGSFLPQAGITLGSPQSLAQLFRVIDGEVSELLILVLSFVTSNGQFWTTPEQIAHALGIALSAAEEALQNAASTLWQGEPLLRENLTPNGLRIFVPSAGLYEIRHWKPARAEPTSIQSRGASNRERVIAYNRERYTRPRAMVEAEIAAFYADEPLPVTPEDHARIELKSQLIASGLTREQCNALLEQFPASEIRRQLEWLPFRNARNPAGYLVAAIEGDYEPPTAWISLAQPDVKASVPKSQMPEEEFIVPPSSTEVETVDE